MNNNFVFRLIFHASNVIFIIVSMSNVKTMVSDMQTKNNSDRDALTNEWKWIDIKRNEVDEFGVHGLCKCKSLTRAF